MMRPFAVRKQFGSFDLGGQLGLETVQPISVKTSKPASKCLAPSADHGPPMFSTVIENVFNNDYDEERAGLHYSYQPSACCPSTGWIRSYSLSPKSRPAVYTPCGSGGHNRTRSRGRMAIHPHRAKAISTMA